MMKHPSSGSDMRVAAYTYVVRGVEYDIPFEAAIASFAMACDTVIVVTDSSFQEGTSEALGRLRERYPNIELHLFQWPMDHPNCDGLSKAYARRLAEKTGAHVLAQFDSDEVLRAQDIPKVRLIAEEMMLDRTRGLVGTGVLNWFNGNHLKWSEPLSKPRFSLNDGRITHGIPFHQRRWWDTSLERWSPIRPHETCLKMIDVFGEPMPLYCAVLDEHGEAVTDGAGFIYADTGLPVSTGRWLCEPLSIETNQGKPAPGELERLVESLTSDSLEHFWILHYSWYSIPRKWEMKPTWHYLWDALGGKYPGGVSEYRVHKDTGEPIDFYEPVIAYGLSKYQVGIKQEMAHQAVLRVEWIQHPKMVELTAWLVRQRVFGRKQNALGKPSRWSRLLRWMQMRFRPYEY